MDFLEQVQATFAPARIDDLRSGLAESIGCRTTWQAAWMIEDGPYTGQWAMMPLPPGDLVVGWVPECDLAEIVSSRAGIPA